MQNVFNLIVEHQAWLFPLFILLLAFILNRFVHWLIKRRLSKIVPHKNAWRHAIYKAIDSPLRAAVWLSAIVIIKHRFNNVIESSQFNQLFAPIVGIFFIFVLTWFLLGLTEHFKKNYTIALAHNQKEVDYTAIDAISKLIWAFVLIFAIVSVLQQLQVPLASLLAFGGAAGIAVGFASQTLVSNLFGGLTVYASRIFKIGEDIIIPGTSLSGTVQHIGWRATHVLGWDGKPFYIPNSLFNSSNMINHSRLRHRAMTEHVLVRYENYDKVKDIIKQGNEFLEQRNDIVYFVFRFDKFGDAALKLMLYVWVQPDPNGSFVPYADFMRVKEEIMLGITDIALANGCELIFPVSNVYLDDKRPSTTIELPEPPASDTGLRQ